MFYFFTFVFGFHVYVVVWPISTLHHSNHKLTVSISSHSTSCPWPTLSAPQTPISSCVKRLFQSALSLPARYHPVGSCAKESTLIVKPTCRSLGWAGRLSCSVSCKYNWPYYRNTIQKNYFSINVFSVKEMYFVMFQNHSFTILLRFLTFLVLFS